jgi:disulfide bond formation protein DsbB
MGVGSGGSAPGGGAPAADGGRQNGRMTTRTFELFFALLALVAAAGVVGLLVARLLAPRSARAAAVVEVFAGPALPLATLVAATCMAGSLYFSEVAHFIPCTLCWYQRIAMYPLVVILAIASVRRDRAIRYYVVPLASIGALISLYHYLVEWFPDAETGVCSATVPCSLQWFDAVFGFISLPFMALCGFALIISLVTLPSQELLSEHEVEETGAPEARPTRWVRVDEGRR